MNQNFLNLYSIERLMVAAKDKLALSLEVLVVA
jgi:hypothetical protein